MADSLEIVRAVIEAHRRIREGMDSLKQKSMADREALDSLKDVRSQWIPGLPHEIASTQQQLEEALGLISQGLRGHFKWEEEVLPKVFGEGDSLFMRALIMEHSEINKRIDEATQAVSKVKLGGLSHEELVTRESAIQEVIGKLCQMVDEHASKEEMILEMVEKAL